MRRSARMLPLKLNFRLVAALAIGITLVTLVVTWIEVRTVQVAQQADLQQRAEFLTGRLREALEPALRQGALRQLASIADRFGASEHVAGTAIYDARGKPLAISANLSDSVDTNAPVTAWCTSDRGCGEFVTLGVSSFFVYTMPLGRGPSRAGILETFLDASGISTRSPSLWWNAFLHVVPQVLLVALLTIALVQAAVLRPIARTAGWMKDLVAGRATAPPDVHAGGLLTPISAEATRLALSLVSARETAEEEARLRDAGDSVWTPERLRVGIGERLRGNRLFVVSNREPYEHVHLGKQIQTVVPASGLVTALEPVLRACDGTWIAHGSGDADRETVDERCRVRVPPDDPRYTLRRVWLTEEEEDGYYFGFANEGLWPLCHIAYTRPIFRPGDWDQYRRVNQKFADAVVEEMAGVDQPFLLVQDYHFALLPRLVKERRPEARVAVFWHIPWPNPEAFGICPWQRELLDGLLGADIVSFHIPTHCNNFLQSIDRALECRIEWERMVVNRANHTTLVRPHPISVAFSMRPEQARAVSFESVRGEVRHTLGIGGLFLGVGVDRVDYTKGIIERFRGIECFLDKYPAYRESLTFVQIGAPSRTRIDRYQELLVSVAAEAARINRKFQTGTWRPILLFTKHHDHEQIGRLYQAADVCLVTSLHDGMNLVAKEFVASRTDEDGVLVLSQFAGACSELRDALIVNPYDVEQLAEAIRIAIEMPADERRTRMRYMRRTVRDYNVYRWAADLISDLAEVRPETADTLAVL